MALHEPTVLPTLLKSEETLDLFFAGLRLHYVECLASGRIEDWRRCAHSIIDLMTGTSDAPQLVKRSDLFVPAKAA